MLCDDDLISSYCVLLRSVLWLSLRLKARKYSAPGKWSSCDLTQGSLTIRVTLNLSLEVQFYMSIHSLISFIYSSDANSFHSFTKHTNSFLTWITGLANLLSLLSNVEFQRASIPWCCPCPAWSFFFFKFFSAKSLVLPHGTATSVPFLLNGEQPVFSLTSCY